ncbi:unnamed protein product [Dovyalis caffra]|uniref:rhamnogalacturonan endolyase n=1 Tax=Dovyalis caffra TaxID=77055 RepID=A0AAV1RST9_9ROSI|nr:unnamed protein product [Dovyalis caffra]
MEKVGASLAFGFFFLVTLAAASRKILQIENCLSPGVRLYKNNHRMVMDNGLVQVTLSSPTGDVTGIQYHGINNALETKNREGNRGYWDVVWNEPGNRITYDRLKGTDFKVIMEDEDQVELSFTKTWNFTNGSSSAPLNVDKRFHFMAISDDRQRIMPMPRDRLNGQRLAYPEAVLLTDPTNPQLKGEVDDKYQYSCDNKNNRVHGWISHDPPVGFWMITPSDEFRAGGPIKQDLTSHVGPTVLSMFTSTHYSGKDLNTKYRNGKPWKKVVGPVFVYLNSISSLEDPTKTLWEDAKDQMSIETKSWPYSFPQSEDFPSSDKRGSVDGQLLVDDKYISDGLMWASYAYVGLAAPGGVGSWQTDAKVYQFWTEANEEGHFSIENIRVGHYNLYAWVPGIVGDCRYDAIINIQPGDDIKLGVLVYEPPRNGPTLWEIGIPDRTAAEFFVPDPDPSLVNKLYINKSTDKFRQYGLWERYTDLYPEHDLVYTIGVSNYPQHWFFAQVTRNMGNHTYQATTWQIKFEIENIVRTGNYTLQLALASATASELQVRINDKRAKRPHFTTGLIGRDNAIARHGIYGLYWFYSINVPSHLLCRGNNTIYLTQPRCTSPFQGIMYDYIRLEGPPETG